MDLAASAVMPMLMWRDQTMILSDQKVPLVPIMPLPWIAVSCGMSEPTCGRSPWVVATCQGMATIP